MTADKHPAHEHLTQMLQSWKQGCLALLRDKAGWQRNGLAVANFAGRQAVSRVTCLVCSPCETCLL